MHATGIYPRWWTGLRLDRTHPLRIWVGGVTATVTRDIIQRKLLGSFGEEGTGYIPADRIKHKAMLRGTPGAIDYVHIQHNNGTTTSLYFKSYEQGQEKWQADTLDWIWFDEEPPLDIWTEGMARLTAVEGRAIMTFTPLKGMSEVVRSFYPRPDSPNKFLVRMGIKDALHIKPDRYDEILSQYPKHEREARLEGIPTLGSGRIYDISEESVQIEPFPIPRHFRRIIGMDIGGGNHPTAWVHCAYDADQDILYVTDCYQNDDPRIAIHASAMRRHGDVPVAWPKDGHTREKTDGVRIADLYRKAGAKMLPNHAQWPDGSVSVEAGLLEIYTRLTEGRLRVFRPLAAWFEEYRTYHRKNGEIVKVYDDLMDATRYAVMGLRYARQIRTNHRVPRVIGTDREPFAEFDRRTIH